MLCGICINFYICRVMCEKRHTEKTRSEAVERRKTPKTYERTQHFDANAIT